MPIIGGPGGAAGGDLSGTYPNPTLAVDRIPKGDVTAIVKITAAAYAALGSPVSTTLYLIVG